MNEEQKKATIPNRFLVDAQGEFIRILRSTRPLLNPEEAINLAVWLVSFAGEGAVDKFKELYEKKVNS